MQIDDKQFEELVNDGFKVVSKMHIDNLNNLAIVVEDDPSPEQRQKLKLRCDQTLFGLFEGVPRPLKSDGTLIAMPDKITIFKNPITHNSKDINDLKNNVRNTLWHEIGHYYGLNHAQIHKLEGKS